MTSDEDSTPEVSVVVACYNEAAHLEASVGELLDTLERATWSFEIVFVDDHSTDETRQVLESILAKQGSRLPMRAVYHETNTGRGRAVSDGMRESRGAVIGYLDIDLEVHARYIPSMVQAIEQGADVAIARRSYRVSPSPSFVVRHVLSEGYRWLSSRILGLRSLDTEAGFKFFRREPLFRLLDECVEPGWFWDTEIMAFSQLMGMSIVEIPSLFLRRKDKQSTLRVIPDTIDYAKSLAAFHDRLSKWRASHPTGPSA